MSVSLSSMRVSRQREKLLNAITFFTKKTKYCNTLKLFKLLNFLDFEHFRQTGKSVTGLHYHAYPQGPVPDELYQEISSADHHAIDGCILITTERDEVNGKVLRRDIKSKSKFDSDYFSRRELAIMELLAEMFRDTKADDMSAFSHNISLPWRRVFQNGRGDREVIPYDLALQGWHAVQGAPTIEREELEYQKEVLSD